MAQCHMPQSLYVPATMKALVSTLVNKYSELYNIDFLLIDKK